MMFMMGLHTDTMQINRHEGFYDQAYKKHKKRTWNPTPVQTREAMGRGATVPRILSQKRQFPPSFRHCAWLVHFGHELPVHNLCNIGKLVLLLSWKSKIHPLSARRVADLELVMEYNIITEPQNILSWKGSPRIIKSNS